MIVDNAITRVWSHDGAVIGIGVLIDAKHILTCAHVVARALTLPDDTPAGPDHLVKADFPLIAPGQLMDARVVFWLPAQMGPATGARPEDVAVLKLQSDAPAGSAALRLTLKEQLWNTPFKVFGVPEGRPEGVWAAGIVRGRQTRGWIQIEVLAGYRLAEGFSGSPVVSEGDDIVLGIVVANDTDPNVRAGFMLPASLLVDASPLLGQATRTEIRLGRLIHVPAPPAHALHRPDDLGTLKRAVLSDNNRNIAISGIAHRIGIQGMGGIGKSVIAAELARDADVRRHFVDGILWVYLGRKPNLLLRQSELAEALGDGPRNFGDIQQGRSRLSELLADRISLLILDDVWATEDIEAFDVLPESSRMLITTRDASVLPDAIEHRLDVLSDDQAIELLARWSGSTPATLPPEAIRVADQCGRLPLALAMAGAMVAGKPNRWANVLNKLKTARIEDIRYKLRDYPYPDLIKALQVSVEALGPDQQDRYLDFAIFPKGVAIPEIVLQTFWAPLGLKEFDSQDMLDTFVNRSLARRDDSGGLTLHDLQMDYVRSQVKNAVALHVRLLDSYAAKFKTSWPVVPDDGYSHAHFTDHLLEAERPNDLHKLLSFETMNSKNGWFEAKQQRGDIGGYVEDIRKALDLVIAGQHNVQFDFSIPLQCRYMLMLSAINSLSDNVPAPLLGALVEAKLWTKAKGIVYARNVPDSEKRCQAIAKLVRFLDPLEREQLVLEAIEAARTIDEDRFRCEALVALIESAPEFTERALRNILAISAGLGPRWKGELLEKLCPLLPISLVPDAIELLRQPYHQPENLSEISDSSANRWMQISIFAQLAPFSERPAALFEEALTIAYDSGYSDLVANAITLFSHYHVIDRAHPEVLRAYIEISEQQLWSNRVEGMVILLSVLDDAQQDYALDRVFADLDEEKGRDPWKRRQLTELARRLPIHKRKRVIPPMLHLSEGVERFKALSDILPLLSEQERLPAMDEALAQAKFCDVTTVTRRLRNIACALEPADWQELLGVVRKVSDDRYQVEALVHIAEYMPEPHRQKLLDETIDIAAQTSNPFEVKDMLALIAPLGSPDTLQKVEQLAGDLRDRDWLINGLAQMIPYLPKESVIEAGRFGLEAARWLREDWRRAGMLADLAETLPGVFHDEAMTIATHISDDYSRARALSALAFNGSNAERQRVREEIARIIEKARDRSKADLRVMLLKVTPQHERGAIMQQTLGELKSLDANLEASVLVQLLPFIDAAQKDTVLADALARGTRTRYEDQVLDTLVPHVSMPLLLNLQDQYRWEDSRVASKIAARLAELGQHNQALDFISEVEMSGQRLEEAIDHIAPGLDYQQLQRLFAMMPRIDNPYVRDAALAVLFSRLAALGHWQEALRRLPELHEAPYRVKVLAEVAAHAEGSQRTQLFRDASSLALQISRLSDRLRVFTQLASRLAILDAATLYPIWLDMLVVLKTHRRRDLVQELYSLTPVFAALAGRATVGDVFKAICDVARWW